MMQGMEAVDGWLRSVHSIVLTSAQLTFLRWGDTAGCWGSSLFMLKSLRRVVATNLSMKGLKYALECHTTDELCCLNVRMQQYTCFVVSPAHRMLTSLRRLDIDLLDDTPGLAAALDASLAQLTNLTAVSMDVGESCDSMDGEVPHLLRLPQLAALRLMRTSLTSNAAVTAATSLTELHLIDAFSDGGADWWTTTALEELPALRRLCIVGQHWSSREPLLPLLRRLQASSPPPAALPGHLQRLCDVLTDVALCGIKDADGGALQGLSRLWALTGLEFRTCFELKSLPPAVVSLKLRRLSIEHCSLMHDLPEGPYLGHLTRLQWNNIGRNCLDVPSCLGQASQLRTLSLSMTNSILLGHHTAALAALPQLQRVQLLRDENESGEPDLESCMLSVQLYQRLNADSQRRVALDFVEDYAERPSDEYPEFEGFMQ